MSVCLPLTPDELWAHDNLVSFWGGPPPKMCAFSATYLEQGGVIPNGCAAPETAGFCANAAPWIAWNRDQMAQPRLGTFALPHEWGHYLQLRYRSPAARWTPPYELQATCLAGVFVGAQRIAGLATVSSLVYSCALLTGDGSVGQSSAVHGTCAQQNAAFKRGYDASLASPENACQKKSASAGTADWALNTACNASSF